MDECRSGITGHKSKYEEKKKESSEKLKTWAEMTSGDRFDVLLRRWLYSRSQDLRRKRKQNKDEDGQNKKSKPAAADPLPSSPAIENNTLPTDSTKTFLVEELPNVGVAIINEENPILSQLLNEKEELELSVSVVTR